MFFFVGENMNNPRMNLAQKRSPFWRGGGKKKGATQRRWTISLDRSTSDQRRGGGPPEGRGPVKNNGSGWGNSRPEEKRGGVSDKLPFV